ncbi:hypothetical protein MERGE_002138 [Pneumocystis wakefieldiae]|uniref:rRNA biogenesis protein RRP5 n=1 Tax=Pneumocystis wakefieldiae TaxID=38082 RepID=A0A899FX12_9ASCO|nr:hypothetical protein MERGE_002138 [Pneumocystis wakefieldiae]
MQRSKESRSKGILNDIKDGESQGLNKIHKENKFYQSELSLKADKDFPRGGNDSGDVGMDNYSGGFKRGYLFDEESLTKRIKADNKKKMKHKTKNIGDNIVSDGLKIESLTFKTITKGMVILGQIEKVDFSNIVVSLPNNLVGYVLIENISKTFSTYLKKSIENDLDNTLSLDRLFHKYQWIKVYVIATSTIELSENNSLTLKDTKQKKKIELSLDPVYTNGNLNSDSINFPLILQASIVSVEDHGYIADIGIEGISGFIKKENTHYSELYEGQVLLCYVTKNSSKGRIVQLSTDLSKIAKIPLTKISDINAFSPGNLVKVMISKIYPNGLCGKIMGLLNATADIFHSGDVLSNIYTKYEVGKIVKARVIFNFIDSESKKVAISLLDHIMNFSTIMHEKQLEIDQLSSIPIGFKIESAIIKKTEPGIGVFCDIGLKNIFGFVHISRLSDNEIKSISPTTGNYKIGSSHQARVIGFSNIDGIYILSMQSSIYNQSHLRLEDFNIAELVSGTVGKIIPQGILIHITEGITGIVPTSHISDVFLLHPERKFKEGDNVLCKVLRKDIEKRKLILTLKKSLINSKYPEITNYDDIKINTKTVGVLQNILDNGAVVEFYNGIKSFLPVSEMSEAYISDPREHFKIGQTVNVYIVSVDIDSQKIRVSCRDPTLWDKDKSEKFNKLELGSFVSGTVISNSNDIIVVSIDSSLLTGIVELGHVSDETLDKCKALVSKMNHGTHLKKLIVLNKRESQRVVTLSIKPSFIKLLEEGNFPSMLSQVKIGSCLSGYIKSIQDYGVFVGFLGNLSGLALKQNISDQYFVNLNLTFFLNQTVSCTVIDIDLEKERLQLSIGQIDISKNTIQRLTIQDFKSNLNLDDIFEKIIQVKIISVKETQLNVEIFEKYHGRIDITRVFDSFEEIDDPQNPFKKFKVNQKIDAKVIGYHDVRNHRFLAITHRSSNIHKTFELTARPSDLKEKTNPLLSLNDININSVHLAFVNNIFRDCIWVNISPNIRGRISILDISDNIDILQDIPKYIHIGSAIQCKVIKSGAEINYLGLSIRALNSNYISDYNSVTIGSIIPGRIIKAIETGFIVQIGENVIGKIYLTDIDDEYTTNLTKKYQKNQIIKVYVLDVDIHNKNVALSSRSSRVTSSLSFKQRDPEIISLEKLEIGKLFRGFIKNIAEKGLFVSLSRNLVARVRIDEISDQFIQDWKSNFHLHDLIEGKIISIDENQRIEMTLKKSKLKSSEPLLEFSEVSKGQIIDGVVRKITNFGIYINLVGYNNVSGLCHISQIADSKVKDIHKIYVEGDVLKSYVLDVDHEKRRISLSLKSSYLGTKKQFFDETETTQLSDDNSDKVKNMHDNELEENVNILSPISIDNQTEKRDSNIHIEEMDNFVDGLSIGKFDWTGNSGFDDDSLIATQEITNNHVLSKKRNKDIDLSQDKTAILNNSEPKTPIDFERLLLGSPDSSYIWIKFMAFHVELSEFDKAREIGERALRSINYRNEKEKCNIWIALMNLENTFGTEESLNDIFKKACQFNDPKFIMKSLCSIFIRSKKYEKANELFQFMIKKYNKSLDVWVNYASFLMENNDHDASRELFSLSFKNLPESDFAKAKSKFAQLEFKYGDPERGRTLFENLISNYPKSTDLWSVFLDYEIKYGQQNNVRKLFQRILSVKISSKKASFFYKKWIIYEKNYGTDESVENVKQHAIEYVSNFK